MFNVLKRIFIFFICMIPLSGLSALELESGSRKVQLLELFTSQGCNSCPPADAFLSRYKQHPDLWKKIVPVAFHVDYWDYIGWKGKYALPYSSWRQSGLLQQGRIDTVYTPEFVHNGREWRGFFSRNKRLPNPSVKNDVGNLKVSVQDKQLTASYSQFQEDQVLHIALLGMDLKTPVNRGENEGKQLQEDFVVLGLSVLFPEKGQWQSELPEVTLKNVKPKAIAAWISTRDDLSPIQATGGWLR